MFTDSTYSNGSSHTPLAVMVYGLRDEVDCLEDEVTRLEDELARRAELARARGARSRAARRKSVAHLAQLLALVREGHFEPVVRRKRRWPAIPLQQRGYPLTNDPGAGLAAGPLEDAVHDRD